MKHKSTLVNVLSFFSRRWVKTKRKIVKIQKRASAHLHVAMHKIRILILTIAFYGDGLIKILHLNATRKTRYMLCKLLRELNPHANQSAPATSHRPLTLQVTVII
jgi:hypothetical protein